ncbi:hypothetical protein T484DRAFT_1839372, partial [Baffinella frigidus]
MQFPSFADFGDDGVCSLEDNSPVAINVKKSSVSERRSSCGVVGGPVVPRAMRRVVSGKELKGAASVADTSNDQSKTSKYFPSFADFGDDGAVVSEEQLQSAESIADTFNNQTRCGSPVSRCDSAGSWLRVSELPVARHLFDEVAGSPRPGSPRHGSRHGSPRPGPLARERPARAVLPEWPAVDDDLVASSKRHLLTFDLDPTTMPTDVLCHLAMEMFVSAGLPAGLAEDRVRRFILAVRASMLDNPYHNFYHVFD